MSDRLRLKFCAIKYHIQVSNFTLILHSIFIYIITDILLNKISIQSVLAILWGAS